jgi:hypothetical protein
MASFEVSTKGSLVLLATVILGLASACSGGSSSGDTAPGDPAAFCNAICAWKTRCEPGSDCAGACATSTDRLRTKVRSSYWAGVAQCVDAQTCQESPDGNCIVDYKHGDPAYPDVPVVVACQAKRAECGNTFTKHYCNSLAALVDAARAEADTCKSKPCDGVEACLVASGAFKLN